MAYQALYRRLRPRRFEDVVGQRHIIRTLLNQINSNRINHAYLFCGTRGTGKTTTAKLFARAINCTCTDSDTTKPCNSCPVCLDILSDKSFNVIELDAASHNGVEDVRAIVEDIKYPPTSGNYKVYIIDEVHMFSNSAFNALLKTLEEPPAYVVFILATTDPQKLPVTVLSRCQRFDFHRISKADMLDVLKKDMAAEGVDIQDSALEYITSVSDGAMRDALSILDQCMSFYYDQTITEDMVREVTGSAGNDVFFSLLSAINNNDSAKTLSIIGEITAAGRDIQQFTADLISHFRNILLAVSLTKSSNALDYSEEYINRLYEQGQEVNYDYLIKLVSMFSDALNQMKYSSNPRIVLEVCCIKACNPVTENDSASLEMRIKAMEKTIQQQNEQLAAAPIQPQQYVNYVPAPQTLPQQTEQTDQNTVPAPSIESMQKIVPEEVKEVIGLWDKFLDAQYKSSIKLTVLKNQCKPAYLENEFVNIVCDDNYETIVNGYKDELHKKLSLFFDRNIPIQIMTKTQHQRRHKELHGFEDSTINAKKDFTALTDTFGDYLDITD